MKQVCTPRRPHVCATGHIGNAVEAKAPPIRCGQEPGVGALVSDSPVPQARSTSGQGRDRALLSIEHLLGPL